MPTITAAQNVRSSEMALVTSPVPVSISPSCGVTTGGSTPHPCSVVSGVQLSTRISINGRPALLAPKPMLCKAADQVPQGTPLFLKPAARVVGT
jgi:hypothetical protein